MSAVLVDSHCHIPLLEEGINLDDILETAAKMGVGHMLCVSIDLDSYPEILNLARQNPCIFASIGIHPNSKVEREISAEELAEKASAREIVAIGETGLDYYRSEGDLAWQKARFRTHIRAARQVSKPLIIHTRDAKADVLQILEEEGANEIGGVMHCFVDDWETAQQAMALNFYISFSGIVTFKNAKTVQAVAKQVPIDRLLVETDSPYLAPVPYRGKQNQPAYVRYVAEYLAELRGVDFAEIAQATTQNFFTLFSNANRIN